MQDSLLILAGRFTPSLLLATRQGATRAGGRPLYQGREGRKSYVRLPPESRCGQSLLPPQFSSLSWASDKPRPGSEAPELRPTLLHVVPSSKSGGTSLEKDSEWGSWRTPSSMAKMQPTAAPVCLPMTRVKISANDHHTLQFSMGRASSLSARQDCPGEERGWPSLAGAGLKGVSSSLTHALLQGRNPLAQGLHLYYLLPYQACATIT